MSAPRPERQAGALALPALGARRLRGFSSGPSDPSPPGLPRVASCLSLPAAAPVSGRGGRVQR
eukprot:15440595-Alexandrium_andersonii.AAC.1